MYSTHASTRSLQHTTVFDVIDLRSLPLHARSRLLLINSCRYRHWTNHPSNHYHQTTPRALINAWWTKKRIADLELNTPITITPDVTCREAIEVHSSLSLLLLPISFPVDQAMTGRICICFQRSCHVLTLAYLLPLALMYITGDEQPGIRHGADTERKRRQSPRSPHRRSDRMTYFPECATQTSLINYAFLMETTKGPNKCLKIMH
jgi:hypothetical protein